MNHLLREHAPITESGWVALDAEARQSLKPALAARRLIDVGAPRGWAHSATNLGRTSALSAAPQDGVHAVARRVLPLVEVRADFSLLLNELRAHDRGAQSLDFASLDHAAHRIAVTENAAVFNGWEEAGIAGIIPSSPYDTKPLGDNANDFPAAVAGAVEQLLRSGVEGPYGLALGREQYKLVVETAERGGCLLLDHLRKILGGPVVWTPGIDGAVVISVRGKDFLYESGQDLSIGYDRHGSDSVDLYIEESFSFIVNTPEAAVVLAA